MYKLGLCTFENMLSRKLEEEQSGEVHCEILPENGTLCLILGQRIRCINQMEVEPCPGQHSHGWKGVGSEGG